MEFTKYTPQTTETVLRNLQTSTNGLSQIEAKKREEVYGKNTVQLKVSTWFDILVRQFRSPFIYLLIFASLLALFLKEYIDSVTIFFFILITGVLGFFQEFRSHQTLKILKKYTRQKCHLRRNGQKVITDSENVVPGDIVLFQAGDKIPADLRIISSDNLAIDESVLTGESVPVEKNSQIMEKEVQEPYQAKNIAFTGTTVTRGQGEGTVFATGGKTVFGIISSKTAATEKVSLFQKGILQFSNFILKLIVSILIIVFFANLLIKGGKTPTGDFLLFSIALAVSVVPEALPVVITASLAQGALKLIKKNVVVKRLSAIEDLGGVEVLCVDKTGTITENKLHVHNIFAQDNSQCLLYAYLASDFFHDGSEKTGNSFDTAILAKTPQKIQKEAENFKIVEEIAFDPRKLRNSVLVEKGQEKILIVRGAPEKVLLLVNRNSIVNEDAFQKWTQNEGSAGRRILTIAAKNLPKNSFFSGKGPQEKDEADLQFIGSISFYDPLKATAKKAITLAHKLGVEVKILTGDSLEVARAVGREIGLLKPEEQIFSGEELMLLDEEERKKVIENLKIFARVTPEEKYEIVRVLEENHAVGFLGEGINDAPALKVANVSLVVQEASDIAQDAADVVLLNKDLGVIIEGIKEGRRIFSNSIKYIKNTISANFGNFFAIATVALILDYLPMLPIQILLVNLLSDFPMISVALDTVDTEELKRPRAYQLKEIILLTIILGIVSSVFDFIFFALFKSAPAAKLQTLWFIESILTELLLIFSIRTNKPFYKAKSPAKILLVFFVASALLTFLLPFSSWGQDIFHFIRPSFTNLSFILVLALIYFLTTEAVKLMYLRSSVSNNQT